MVKLHQWKGNEASHLIYVEMSVQNSERHAVAMFLRGNPDSEESISDDEETAGLHDVVPNNVVSLDDATYKQELPLPVRLELLKGISYQNLAGRGRSSGLSLEKPLEDEVEMPDFKEDDFRRVSGEVVADSSDEDIDGVLFKVCMEYLVKKNLGLGSVLGSTVLSTRHFHKYGSRFIRNDQVKDTNGNSEAMLCFKESSSCSISQATCSKANTSGIWSKANPSVAHTSMHIGPAVSNIDRLSEIKEAVDPEASENFVEDYLEDDFRMEIKADAPAKTEALALEFNQPSIADIFDNLQDKYDPYFPRNGQRRGKAMLRPQKNSRSHFQDKVVEREDSPEPLDSGSSSDNEVDDQQVKMNSPRKKMQTMADRFQEALGSSSVINEASHVGALNSLSTGIFGKLQQVMQKEKESDMDFWKKLQAGARPDSEHGCVDVKIISRYLDGKLTVCHCSFGKYTENFLLQDEGMGSGGSKSGQSTIIFSPRVCDHVDLEVGNFIRIHPPWKEVQVGNDNIILCTYFSEISYPV
ncbi:uncharacterized protein LOC130724019 isoform X2 [Lotus japonicus]|uniref:uncharacterized protein LOC130724019 isoform X2 n=1 Tax=Lotus japonicus TaxID=34305 RepID=UPI0025853E12|nr:uncharacterized protein LOC130724019 isoform X2 [Lotus japonicus]